MIRVRPAEEGDADAAISVVRRSISELCIEDHHNDRETLESWLENKTSKNFLKWLFNAENYCVVAESAGRLLGVAVLQRQGEILMFYLAPGEQRQGIGMAIQSALEHKAVQWELTSLHLESTALARSFYEAVGFQSIGEAVKRFGALQCFPYAKALQPNKALKPTVLKSQQRGLN